MVIIIETPTGEQFKFFFELSDRIEDLNAKLAIKFGVPIDQQSLYFQDQKLEKEKIFSDYSIVDNSIIKLVYNLQKEMHVIIKALCKTLFTLDVESTDTIMNIREKIRNKKGLIISDYDIFYNDVVLENEKTLQDYSIKDDCVLSIDKPISSSIDIKVRLESNELKLFYVYSNDKIKKIKNKIQDELKYPINLQILTFNHVLLDDEKTIQFYGIQYNSEISLEIKQIIHVNITFNIDDELKNAVYDVYSSDMIISLKDRIQREKGIPVDEQSLRLNDIYLSNYKTFKDYSIQNNTVLKFISMMISCSTPNTKCTYDFRVCPENSIREVKRKIEQKTGYFANKMFLYLNKIPLDDYKQVKDYPFYNWSNINIVFRYMGD